MTSDPFTTFAETHAPAKKPRRVTVRKREAARREKALQERDQLFRAHEHWRGGEIASLLTGPHGASAQALIDFLERMQSELDLVERVCAGPWRDANADTRFLILTLIDGAITRQRERQGLPPFDDPLPGKPPSAFLKLRAWLAIAAIDVTKFSRSAESACISTLAKRKT